MGIDMTEILFWIGLALALAYFAVTGGMLP